MLSDKRRYVHFFTEHTAEKDTQVTYNCEIVTEVYLFSSLMSFKKIKFIVELSKYRHNCLHFGDHCKTCVIFFPEYQYWHQPQI